jgi:hypothetical protein
VLTSSATPYLARKGLHTQSAPLCAELQDLPWDCVKTRGVGVSIVSFLVFHAACATGGVWMATGLCVCFRGWVLGWLAHA